MTNKKVSGLLSRIKLVFIKTSLETKRNSKMEKTFAKVPEVKPKHPLTVYPLRYHRPPEDPSLVTFPLSTEPPSAFRLKQLTDAMLGPSSDKTDWSKPFTFSPSTSPVQTTTSPSARNDHDNSTAAFSSVNKVTIPNQHSISEEILPYSDQNVHPEFPKNCQPHLNETGNVFRRSRQHLTFLQHHGSQSESISLYAPQASRQEVGYAYVRLWEYVFGESESAFGES